MIEPYKQSFTHSCLVACFLMLSKERYKIKPNAKLEEKILIEGMKRKYPFYVLGIPSEFINHVKKPVNLFVDNRFFTNILQRGIKNSKLKVNHRKISLDFIRELLREKLIICHIDDNLLGDYSHASHFVIIEKATDKRFVLIDPMDGKRKSISNRKLEKAIESLKQHIKMCPLVYCL